MERPNTHNLHDFYRRHARNLDLYRFVYFRKSLDGKNVLLNIELKDGHKMAASLLEMPSDFYNSIPKESFAGGFLMVDALYPLYLQERERIPEKSRGRTIWNSPNF